MGELFYGSARTRIRMDDRVLVHLRTVVVTKLRRGESFLLSWRDSIDIGDGYSSVWIYPQVDLHYKFDGARQASIDPASIERMLAAAGTPGGLELNQATLISRV